MKKYMIEREIPKIGSLSEEQLRQVVNKSNNVLSQLAPDIEWGESFVTADKTFCVYEAIDEEIIKLHAYLSGLPASKITEIRKVVAPTAAAPVNGESVPDVSDEWSVASALLHNPGIDTFFD
jgi:hypothetical protein